jgi:hypothetical protein
MKRRPPRPDIDFPAADHIDVSAYADPESGGAHAQRRQRSAYLRLLAAFKAENGITPRDHLVVVTFDDAA